VIHTRYAGAAEGELTRPAWLLLSEERLRDAYRLGIALRLAFTLSGGAPDALKRTKLKRDGAVLQLRIAKGAASLGGESVERRMEALAEAFDRKPRIRYGR
jgi:exopolyphosphatase/guanosine-5'-triphosphate,3'-diphosphate pyrophosphatase